MLPVQTQQLRRLSQSLDLRTTALAEQLAIALHGIDRAAGRIKGARCFVSGARLSVGKFKLPLTAADRPAGSGRAEVARCGIGGDCRPAAACT